MMAYDSAIAQSSIDSSNVVPKDFVPKEYINLVYENIDFGEEIYNKADSRHKRDHNAEG